MTDADAKHLYAILKRRAWMNSYDHGFWEDQNSHDVNVQLKKLALIVEEVGEAIAACRVDPKGACDKPIPVTALGEELADIVIRCADLATAMGIDLPWSIIHKHGYNAGRPYMHGKKA